MFLAKRRKRGDSAGENPGAPSDIGNSRQGMAKIFRGFLVVWCLLVAGMPFGWAYETIPIASDPFGIATAPIHPPEYPSKPPAPLRTMTLSDDPWEIFQTGQPVNHITLDPGRYPSQQGWTINSQVSESQVFTPGAVMRINSMGIGSAWCFASRGDFNPALPSVIIVRALVSQEEGYPWDHWGLNFGISANLQQASVGLGPNATIDDYGNSLSGGSNTSYRTFPRFTDPLAGRPSTSMGMTAS